jgi:hypothetical protein
MFDNENISKPYSENAIFKFGYKNKVFFSDSIYTKLGRIDFHDYNNDGIKDILIQNISDAKSNWTYNLYLVNLEEKKLKKINSFNSIKNPQFNDSLNIIESYVSSGTNYTQFYSLTKNDNIIDYNITVYDNHGEESEESYSKAIEKIKSQ